MRCLMSPLQIAAMIAELATASGLAGMCGGQALDLDAEDKTH